MKKEAYPELEKMMPIKGESALIIKGNNKTGESEAAIVGSVDKIAESIFSIIMTCENESVKDKIYHLIEGALLNVIRYNEEYRKSFLKSLDIVMDDLEYEDRTDYDDENILLN